MLFKICKIAYQICYNIFKFLRGVMVNVLLLSFFCNFICKTTFACFHKNIQNIKLFVIIDNFFLVVNLDHFFFKIVLNLHNSINYFYCLLKVFIISNGNFFHCNISVISYIFKQMNCTLSTLTQHFVQIQKILFFIFNKVPIIFLIIINIKITLIID